MLVWILWRWLCEKTGPNRCRVLFWLTSCVFAVSHVRAGSDRVISFHFRNTFEWLASGCCGTIFVESNLKHLFLSGGRCSVDTRSWRSRLTRKSTTSGWLHCLQLGWQWWARKGWKVHSHTSRYRGCGPVNYIAVRDSGLKKGIREPAAFNLQQLHNVYLSEHPR